jgi:hypothetical protein
VTILLEVAVSGALVALWMAWPHQRRTFGSRMGFVVVAGLALPWAPLDLVWVFRTTSRMPVWAACGILGLALMIRIVAAVFNGRNNRKAVGAG